MQPDAVIFDVDGVLVETESSYIEAVARAVQWLLVNEIGLEDDGPAIDRLAVRLWKRTGRWNDDWDLTYALYLWLTASAGATTTERRRSAGDAEAAARRDMADIERSAPQPHLTWGEVRGIFEEIYNGTPIATSRYGVRARVDQERGLAETERILLEAGLLRELAEMGIDKLGVVTGRSSPDWERVRAQIPLPVETAIATMEDGRKPDPAPLAKVVASLRPRAFVAIGDTLSDLEMVQRWNATPSGDATPGIAITLCPPDDEAAYRAAGATLFIRSLADLPSLVRSLSSRPARR